jgi:hypothetical protein
MLLTMTSMAVSRPRVWYTEVTSRPMTAVPLEVMPLALVNELPGSATTRYR